MDDGYIENLYSDMTSLYRLDQITGKNSMNSGQADLGRLPGLPYSAGLPGRSLDSDSSLYHNCRSKKKENSNNAMIY